MRRLAIGVCAAALTVVAAAAADDPVEQRAFKGWELYAWQDGGDWKFAMLVGTNRNKFCDEVKNPKGVLDLAQAEAALGRLAEFDWVSLGTPADLQRCGGSPRLPADMMKRLQRTCERRALHCQGFGGTSDHAPKD